MDRGCLVGHSPWGLEESDTTEWLHFHFSLSCIGEGNGNPLQYSCLDNPRDGGAWWAAVYGVSQSQTWLKWLSSSSSSSSSSMLLDIWKHMSVNWSHLPVKDWEAWHATVPGVARSGTWLSKWTLTIIIGVRFSELKSVGQLLGMKEKNKGLNILVKLY